MPNYRALPGSLSGLREIDDDAADGPRREIPGLALGEHLHGAGDQFRLLAFTQNESPDFHS